MFAALDMKCISLAAVVSSPWNSGRVWAIGALARSFGSCLRLTALRNYANEDCVGKAGSAISNIGLERVQCPADMSNIGLNGVQHLVDMTGKDQFAPGQSEPHDLIGADM